MSRITTSAPAAIRKAPSAHRRLRALALCSALAATGAVGVAPQASAEHHAQALPGMITVEREGFRPEGIAWDPTRNAFLLGSLMQQTVQAVAADGSLTPVVSDPELTTVVGIEVDVERGRLIVCNGDFAALNGARGQAKLGIYDLATGERTAMLDLTKALTFGAETFFPNDIALAPDGTLFITDSAARLIYRVSPALEVSVIAPVSFLNPPLFFLNGIEYHPDGYLIAAEMRTGRLWRIEVDGSERAAMVKLPEALVGVDGLIWRGENELVTVSNETNRVSLVRSEDGWKTATVAAQHTLDAMATTAAVVDDAVYVIHAHFEDLKRKDYEIERVPFEAP